MRPGLSFEEWNGDKLANLIQSSFLREDILPKHARSLFRKSLAMIDVPDISFKNFAKLVGELSELQQRDDRQRVTAMRQIAICLWIMFAWAREAENMESAYLSGERALLHGWKIASEYKGRSDKFAEQIGGAFQSIFSAYSHVSNEYLAKNVIPYAGRMHALSAAVAGSCAVDVNLRMFEVLGRLGVAGLWSAWVAGMEPEDSAGRSDALEETKAVATVTMAMIENNPTLFLPVKDDQVIDISLVLSLLALDSSHSEFMRGWLDEMIGRAAFALDTNGPYPSVIDRYDLLVRHPESRDEEYRESATKASVLYPVVALWACLLGAEEVFKGIRAIQSSKLAHSTFQLWFPDASSEEHFYQNGESHGSALADLTLSSPSAYLELVRQEVRNSSGFEGLSSVRYGWWPIVAVACRHYRLPVPVHLFRGLVATETAVST
jgi:hypothetical protein